MSEVPLQSWEYLLAPPREPSFFFWLRIYGLRVAVYGWEYHLLDRNVQRFRGGLVFKVLILLYHSTLGLRVIKKKKSTRWLPRGGGVHPET